MLSYEERIQVGELARNRSRELWKLGTEETETERATRLILGSMQSENTGGSFLDSGDAYGRNWERAALREYGEAVPTSLRANYDYLEVTIDLGTFLGEYLEYDPLADLAFQSWVDSRQNSPSYWSDIQSYCDMLWNLSGESLGSIYGDRGEVLTYNTYNEENLLSSVFQFAFFYTPGNYSASIPEGFSHGEPYMILHTHNGADVRGGYGKPRVFGFQGKHDPEGIFDWSRAYIVPEEPDPRFPASQWGIPQWETDNAYNWRYEGYPERGPRDPFPMWIPAYDSEYNGIHWVEWTSENLEEYAFCSDPEELEETEGIKVGDLGTGYIVDNGEAVFCPITGSPLSAYSCAGM